MKFRIHQLWFLLLLAGCDDFLEEKSQDQIHPSSVTDLEQLFLGEAYVENENIGNATWFFTDDVQSNGIYSTAMQTPHDKYKWYFIWSDQMFTSAGAGFDPAFYQAPYEGILGCNLVLDNLDKMQGDENLRENLRGEALTLRAYYYLHLVNFFGKAYNQGNPATDLAVPLKLNSTVTGEFFARNTVQEVYDQIEADLLEGNQLLEEYDFDRNYFRMGHLAAKALLSRLYLYQENWDKALEFADEVLQKRSELLDFNTLDITSRSTSSVNYWTSVYDAQNPVEVIWGRPVPSNYADGSMLISPFTTSDEMLSSYKNSIYSDYTSKKVADIRGVVYFKWDKNYFGNKETFRDRPAKYTGTNDFQGIRVAEIYLNRAEAYIQKYLKEGTDTWRQAALDDLNKLRAARFNAAYPADEIVVASGEELLEFCLEERRRELIGEGNHRYCDLRRYNKKITHILRENNTETTCEKEMGQFVLPLQEEVLEWNPDLQVE